jgi:hypothetical protein
MRMLSEYPEDFDRGIPNESLHHIEWHWYEGRGLETGTDTAGENTFW